MEKKESKINKPICVINTPIGRFQIDVRENRHYSDEIIISEHRYTLPDGIGYKNVRRITIIGGTPVMAYLTYRKDEDELAQILVQFNHASFGDGYYMKKIEIEDE